MNGIAIAYGLDDDAGKNNMTVAAQPDDTILGHGVSESPRSIQAGNTKPNSCGRRRIEGGFVMTLKDCFLLAALLSPFALHAQTLPTPNLPLTGTGTAPCILGGGYKACASGEVDSLLGVATNASLEALSTAQASAVMRWGFTIAGDAPPLVYVASASACSLNAGAGDNGSQVQSADGKCWVANFPTSGITPTEFGAVGDGTANDTTDVQAAVNAAAAAGVPLRFDLQHLYYVASTITVASPIDIEGQEHPALLPTIGLRRDSRGVS
jgi:hypothetical protein